MSPMSRLLLLICLLGTDTLANRLHGIQHSKQTVVQRHNTGYYEARSVPCGASMTLYSGMTLNLQSPGYPYRYCYNCNCQWAFSSRNANDRLQLTCRDFQMENSRDCTTDYMAVQTSSGYIQRFCGYSGPSNFQSSGYMRIMFTSNSYLSFRGFSCSLSVYATSGTVVTAKPTTNPVTSIVSPDSSTVTQCKCGQQQGKRKKRSNNLPEEEVITQDPTGNQTEIEGISLRRPWQDRTSNMIHPLRNRKNIHSIRVVGGTVAKKHEFPWMVLITYEGRDVSICGGAIINNKYIISAAHCLLSPAPPYTPLDPSDLILTLGEHDRSTSTETTETIKKNVARIIVHPDFDGLTLNNDIGLIELQEPLNLESTSNIAPVCPPDQNDLYEDRDAVIAGWGFTKSPLLGLSNSDILLKATLKIYKNIDCEAKYTKPTEVVTDNMLCAFGSNNEDACANDSGGPLMVEEDGSWVVVGLISWGPSDGTCGGSGGKPGVYTRVGNYLEWIGSNIKKSSTCPPMATTRNGNSLRSSFGLF